MSPGQMSKSRVEAPSAAAEPRLAPQPGFQNLRARCGTRSSQQALTRPPAASFDHLVGACDERFRHADAERLRGLEVENQLNLRGLLDRQVGRLVALENAADIDPSQAISVGEVGPVTHQAACGDEVTILIDGGMAWRRASAASWRLRVLKNGSVPISSALDRSSRNFAKMSVSWPSVLARKTCSCNPNLCAAACTSLVWLGTLGLVGLTRRAMTAPTTSSCRNSSRFGPSSTFKMLTPVMLPPGCLRLVTSPSSIGSKPAVKTIGIVVVAALTWSAPGLLAKITVGCNRASSAARAGSRS